MGSGKGCNANGVARHSGVEGFATAAYGELQAAPYWQRGVCFNPACSKHFEPTRDWQMYCGKPCERIVTQELRRWGHRLALPSLVHRMGKYEQKDAAIAERTRAARRFITQVQSAWLEERRALEERSRKERAGGRS